MYPTGLALRPGRRPTGQLCTGVYDGLGRRLSRSPQEHEQEAAQDSARWARAGQRAAWPAKHAFSPFFVTQHTWSSSLGSVA